MFELCPSLPDMHGTLGFVSRLATTTNQTNLYDVIIHTRVDMIIHTRDLSTNAKEQLTGGGGGGRLYIACASRIARVAHVRRRAPAVGLLRRRTRRQWRKAETEEGGSGGGARRLRRWGAEEDGGGRQGTRRKALDDGGWRRWRAAVVEVEDGRLRSARLQGGLCSVRVANRRLRFYLPLFGSPQYFFSPVNEL